MKRFFLLACTTTLSLVAIACSSASSDDASIPDEGGGADAAAPNDAVAPDATEAATSCNGAPLHAYDESPGVLMRLYGEVPYGGKSSYFLIDMGSPQTFADIPANAGGADAGPTYVDDAGLASISCVGVSIPGFSGSVSEKTPDGVQTLGTLGCDLIGYGASLDLRISESRFFWWKTPPAPPPSAVVLPAVLGQTKTDIALVASGITLDGAPVRLMLDTGSPHVLIISATARPNESQVQTVDGIGNPVTLYTSTLQIAFNGGAARTVAVDRAVPGSFPDLEGLLTDLGGGIQGLLGLNALGHDRIMISKSSLAFVP